MELMRLGGWMMWPLLAASVAALAIVIERSLVLFGCSFPDSRFEKLLHDAVQTGSMAELSSHMGKTALVRNFAALLVSGTVIDREAALRTEGELIVARLEARLSLLALLARLSPLMGLLGTILGMIATFSHIADARTGVDMAQLSGGIWQALLTTAAGLIIAIPSLFFLSLFRNRVRRVAFALNQAGNAGLRLQKDPKAARDTGGEACSV